MYIYISIYVYLYLYLYLSLSIYIYIYTHVCVYIYIYIYIFSEVLLYSIISYYHVRLAGATVAHPGARGRGRGRGRVRRAPSPLCGLAVRPIYIGVVRLCTVKSPGPSSHKSRLGSNPPKYAILTLSTR